MPARAIAKETVVKKVKQRDKRLGSAGAWLIESPNPTPLRNSWADIIPVKAEARKQAHVNKTKLPKLANLCCGTEL
ncbi:hypothetical protein HYFRA_00004883 [Hymenoscyphus fraxineus]|uniref:Uncharacterized protein n=1 Tax=Hymenoscyphus fraxineus TaxID=746836 RepID=A0A9N9KM78_9HELO|nr:hypothetical protein HYFRA_00004883 [Hymenoscyphus fraxineus]